MRALQKRSFRSCCDGPFKCGARNGRVQRSLRNEESRGLPTNVDTRRAMPTAIHRTGRSPSRRSTNSQIPPKTKKNPAKTQNPSNLRPKYFRATCAPSVRMPTPRRPAPQPTLKSTATPIQMKNRPHPRAVTADATLLFLFLLIIPSFFFSHSVRRGFHRFVAHAHCLFPLSTL
jgi:hypothetical protein